MLLALLFENRKGDLLGHVECTRCGSQYYIGHEHGKMTMERVDLHYSRHNSDSTTQPGRPRQYNSGSTARTTERVNSYHSQHDLDITTPTG